METLRETLSTPELTCVTQMSLLSANQQVKGKANAVRVREDP
jgi:hypothetical protein